MNFAQDTQAQRQHLLQQAQEQTAAQEQIQEQVQEQTAVSEQINNEDLNPIDEFERDVLIEVKPSADTVIQEDGTKIIEPKESQSTAAVMPTVEKQYINTMTFIELRDMIQSRVISLVADGSLENNSAYSYSEKQKKMLAEAWHPLLVKKNINIGPEAQILITEAICNIPLVELMLQNRKYRLKAEASEKEAKALRQQLAKAQGNINSIVKNPEPSNRRDNKNAWKVDKKGYFIFKPIGAPQDYIKEEARTERPKFPDDLEKLILHNGREHIAEVYNMPELIADNDS